MPQGLNQVRVVDPIVKKASPYGSMDQLPDEVKQMGPDAASKWMAAYNEACAEYDEDDAMAMANAAVRRAAEDAMAYMRNASVTFEGESIVNRARNLGDAIAAAAITFEDKHFVNSWNAAAQRIWLATRQCRSLSGGQFDPHAAMWMLTDVKAAVRQLTHPDYGRMYPPDDGVRGISPTGKPAGVDEKPKPQGREAELGPELSNLWLEAFTKAYKESGGDDAFATASADAALADKVPMEADVPEIAPEPPPMEGEMTPGAQVDPNTLPPGEMEPSGVPPGDEMTPGGQKPNKPMDEMAPTNNVGDAQTQSAMPSPESVDDDASKPGSNVNGPEPELEPEMETGTQRQTAPESNAAPNEQQNAVPNAPPNEPQNDPDNGDDMAVDENDPAKRKTFQPGIRPMRKAPPRGVMMSESARGEVQQLKEPHVNTFTGKPARVQVFRTGQWNHPKYGEFKITARDLERMVDNFEKSERALVVDYDHGTDIGKSPEDRVAAGWIRKLKIERKGDAATLWADVDMVDDGYERVKSGKYRYFSPTWVSKFADKETGQDRGITLLRGALTNNPYIDGMHPVVPLNGGESDGWSYDETNGATRLPIVMLCDDPSSGWVSTATSNTGSNSSWTVLNFDFTGAPDTAVGAAFRKAVGAVGGGVGKGDQTMADVGGVKIAAERIGMPASSTNADIEAQVYLMAEENVRLRADKERLLRKLEEYQGAVTRLKEVEVELLLREAVKDGKIDKNDEGFVKDMYMKNPVETKRWLDSRPSRRWMAMEQGIFDGNDVPSNAVAEVLNMAAEKKAENPKLTDYKAMAMVLNENPELARRYREATTTGLEGR